ncbi:MAG: hypothetical protein WA902_22495 [Thermosynechococcaceae cyanobacterium]
MSSADYDEIAKFCEQLSYRDKFRLAQLLIQLARKAEEEKSPNAIESKVSDSKTVEYVAARLQKLKPKKKATLLNSIGAMFQFQGGISDEAKATIVDELQQRKYIIIDRNSCVSYKN